MKTPAELTDRFRSEGLKITPQRQCIFRILHDVAGQAVSHPTAESVYQLASAEMPAISLRTVYQTLNDLVAMGELEQLDIRTGSTRFDPNLEPHHHLVCDSCGRVSDLYVDFEQVELPAREADGFVLSSTEIVFHGRCASCAPAA